MPEKNGEWLKRWTRMEWIGIPTVYGAVCLLHFVYDWSGGSVWAGIFAAANESVWEHVKIFGIAYAAYAAVEFAVLKPPVRRFAVAKAAGLWFLVVALTVFFYLYTAIVGRHLLAVDLIASAVWVGFAFRLSWVLLQSQKSEPWFVPAAFALVLFAVCYLSFTVNPPDWALFEDPQSGKFGLPEVGVSVQIPV